MRNILHLFLLLLPLLFAPVRAKYRNVTVDNTDPSIQYVGNWSTCNTNLNASYDGTRNCSVQDGATATFTFTGVAIYYIAPLIPNVTTVLALDSGPGVLVNLSQAQGESPDWAVRWGASGLDNGPHTLINYGPSNTTTPSGTTGEVDAFIYTVVEQDSNVAAIAGGAVAGAVALASVGACYVFGQHLADWLRHLAFVAFGWLLFRGRRFTFISDVPDETQITLFLTLTPGLPGSTSATQSSSDGEDNVLSWKVLHIGPGKRQEVVHLPSRGRTGDPGLVFCTLNEMRTGFEANVISLGAASDYIQKEDTYEWASSDRPGISVRNQAPDDEHFALATPFDKGGADPFYKFTVPKNASREFTGSLYVHAFRTTGATSGLQLDFSDPDFVANRITAENGCEVSQLGPITYWYVYQSGKGLKVQIGKSRKDIKRYKHQLELSAS